MRAVNLIPVDERRAGSTGASRSGGMVYVLLGALFIGLVMIMAVTLVNRSLSDKRTELADVKAQADAAQAKATALAPYTRFAQLRAKRVETVKSLAASRFDWAHAMHEVARVIPENVALQTLKGAVGQSSGTASTPSIEIGGCTTSQKSVARMMARMRLVDGVEHVGLKASEKGGASAGGGTTGGSAGAGCGTSDQAPTFLMVISFAAKAAVAPAATAGAAVPSTPTTGSTP